MTESGLIEKNLNVEEKYKNYLKSGQTLLHDCIIGSHLYCHAREDSDVDHVLIYIEDLDKILDGTATLKTTQRIDKQAGTDYTIYEIGFFVQQLLKGHFNFYEILMSDRVIISCQYIDELRDLAKRNIGQHILPSLNGLIIRLQNEIYEMPTHVFGETGSNLISNHKRDKKIVTLIRLLQMGITLMETSKFKFEPPDYINADVETKKKYTKALTEKYEKLLQNNNMSKELVDETSFRCLLVNIRRHYDYE